MHPVRIALLIAALGASSAQAGMFDDEEARRLIVDQRIKNEARFDQQAKAQLDLAGLRELLTTTVGKGLGCDGVFLDTQYAPDPPPLDPRAQAPGSFAPQQPQQPYQPGAQYQPPQS